MKRIRTTSGLFDRGRFGLGRIAGVGEDRRHLILEQLDRGRPLPESGTAAGSRAGRRAAPTLSSATLPAGKSSLT